MFEGVRKSLRPVTSKVHAACRSMGFDVISVGNRVGFNALDDMAKFLPRGDPVIFDVGANVGQSIEKFGACWPKASIHSFEPSPATFALLRDRVVGRRRVRLWNQALGSSLGQCTLLENSHAVMSSFLPLDQAGWGKIVKETAVEVNTLDNFCAQHDIDRIDILKTDTQGFDLEVLKGAESTMRQSKIGMIFCEVIFSNMYKGLPSLGQTYDFLTERDFLFVSFYTFSHQNRLAGWADMLWIHKSLYLASTLTP